ncbi:MAG TPA: hypothetical protein PLK99_07820, partial [Burkholderiales bacterium]|nr:hypothetical protein [Burkholderiales bacterium]
GTVRDGASYDINTPNGGNVTIHCNSIVKNPNASNYPMVTTGEEGGLYPSNSLAVTDNLFTSNASGKPIVGVQNRIPGMTATVTGNIFVRIPHDTAGSGSFSASGNADSRSNASMPGTCGRIGANLKLPGKQR